VDAFNPSIAVTMKKHTKPATPRQSYRLAWWSLLVTLLILGLMLLPYLHRW
jgi:hypothetical protein